MATDAREDTGAEATCPICTLWNAYKKSDAAKHVRGIEREGLLLVRCLLNACIGKRGEEGEAQEGRGEAD